MSAICSGGEDCVGAPVLTLQDPIDVHVRQDGLFNAMEGHVKVTNQ